ncbi:uncharacterized protein LOC113230070 [Hyposmocoma kahamanoa]|uniref:uncharacterized protein LOC113230070 n=1 Tax=Hyposmocoma kahamanoa TaxID=1477025 RepID=UPI000E6D790F|nr:uncharacterized protein LOC113230070 [Hyposmocoma kahamanoa]
MAKNTYRQKKKLSSKKKNPQLISCKVTPEFNYRDSQRLWQTLANECNAIPGSKKTWRQWRKVYVFLLIYLNLPLCSFLDLTRMELVFPQEKHGCLEISRLQYKHSSKHSNNSVFNCDLLAVHERRKVELKEEYV